MASNEPTDADSSYPTTDDGDLDHEAMVREMGLANITPMRPVFIAGDTGEVVRVLSVNTRAGEARLRDTHNGTEWDVPLPELWMEWMHGPLTFRDRAFLRDDQRVVDTQTLYELDAALDCAPDCEGVEIARDIVSALIDDEL